MSRNRPRPRDNGLGNNEEMELWTRICQDIRKSKEKFDQQASLSVQIKTLVEKITREGSSKCTSLCGYQASIASPSVDHLRAGVEAPSSGL
jgi:SAGA-associated factor 29